MNHQHAFRRYLQALVVTKHPGVGQDGPGVHATAGAAVAQKANLPRGCGGYSGHVALLVDSKENQIPRMHGVSIDWNRVAQAILTKKNNCNLLAQASCIFYTS